MNFLSMNFQIRLSYSTDIEQMSFDSDKSKEKSWSEWWSVHSLHKFCLKCCSCSALCFTQDSSIQGEVGRRMMDLGNKGEGRWTKLEWIEGLDTQSLSSFIVQITASKDPRASILMEEMDEARGLEAGEHNLISQEEINSPAVRVDLLSPFTLSPQISVWEGTKGAEDLITDRSENTPHYLPVSNCPCPSLLSNYLYS